MFDWLRRRRARTNTSTGAQRAATRTEGDAGKTAADADASFAVARIAVSQGRWADAADAYTAALDQRHDWARAHHELGLCMHRLGRYEDACDCYELALHFEPRLARVRLDRAHAERERGDRDAALASVRSEIETASATTQAYVLLGSLLVDAGDIDGAIEAFEHAVVLDPESADAHSNLGYLLFRDRAQYERGGRHIERALELAPENLACQCNFTMVLSYRGELDRLLELCNRILEREPGMDEVRLNRGLALLKLDRFDAGWCDYEARKRVRSNFLPRDLPWAEWQGEPLVDKTLLVYGEQGLGDEIMFSSCMPDVMRRAGHCVIECEPRLVPLFRRSFEGATVVPRGQSRGRPDWTECAPGIDLQIAAGSLPLHLRRCPGSFPMHTGYLSADPERKLRWRRRLDALGPGLKVGMSWRGGMQSTRRDLRSIPLGEFVQIFDTPGAHFVDLQYGDTQQERAMLASQHGRVLHSWPDLIDDLDELAALVGELDLIISVCTAVIHLAGALGREVWVLVPSTPEWRYRQHGEGMPWYPSACLLRQQVGQEWRGVIEDAARRLRGRFRATTEASAPRGG